MENVFLRKEENEFWLVNSFLPSVFSLFLKVFHSRNQGRGEGGERGERKREGERIAFSCSEVRFSSPGSWQTVCGDVTPDFQTMINTIICIKFEWVLVFRENASDDECS